MGIELSASDVFEMARWVEEQGAAFYDRMARSTRDPEAQKLLDDLYKMERDHEQTFSGLKAELAQRGELKLAEGTADYGRLLSQMCVQFTPEAMGEFTGRESPGQVMQLALHFEAVTVAFYTAMKEMISEEDRRSVDRIIREELGHILTLSGHSLPAGRPAAITRPDEKSPLHGRADLH